MLSLCRLGLFNASAEWQLQTFTGNGLSAGDGFFAGTVLREQNKRVEL
jgi:hypothetical protein